MSVNRVFLVENLFNELKTEGEKRVARLNLGVKDEDSLTWGNIGGLIMDLLDLVEFVEAVKMLASLTGTVIIFKLNNSEIDRTWPDVPEGWSLNLPDTTSSDELYMSLATKKGGIYLADDNGIIWSFPIKINYTNTTDLDQEAQILELRERLNQMIQDLTAFDNILQTMNKVSVNEDGSISVIDGEGNVSVWLHQDLGNYLLLGNAYGDDTTFFILSKEGLLRANNAIIYGTVYATDGWFAGELRAATGSFTGEINATAGTIGGWEIRNGVLRPLDVPTSALVGKIKATLVEFGNLLSDLEDEANRYTDSKLVVLENGLIGRISNIETALTLKQGLIESRVEAIVNVQGVFQESLNSLSDKLRLEKLDRLSSYQTLSSKITQTANEILLNVALQFLTYSPNLSDYVTLRKLESELSIVSGKIAAKVSQTDFDVRSNQIALQIAELAITPEQIQAIVQSELNNYSPRGLVTKTEYLSTINLLADSISSKVSTSTYNANNTLINNKFSQLILTSNSITAEINENNLLLASLGISSEGINLVGKTLVYYGINDPTPAFRCIQDGSGQIAKGNITWDYAGYGTLANRINWGPNEVTLTDNSTYDITVDSNGLVVSGHIDEEEAYGETHTLPNGLIIRLKKPLNIWQQNLLNVAPYAKLTNTELLISSGFSRTIHQASSAKISASEGLIYSSLGIKTTINASGISLINIIKNIAAVGDRTVDLTNERIRFIHTTSELPAPNLDSINHIKTVTLSSDGIIYNVDGSESSITWEQLFTKLNSIS